MDTVVKQSNALAAAVVRLLRPLARILLHNGFSFDAFAALAKRAYVEVANEEFRIAGKKQTISRISILSGLTRKEVQRTLNLGSATDDETAERYNRAARVIAGWVRDQDFTDARGNPLPLSVEDGGSGFARLVKRYSGDMPARAVLDELLRVGAVEQLPDGHVRVVARAYVPRTSDIDKLAILGSDVSDLIYTIAHNLQRGASDPFFQRKVMYDNLPREAIAEFRRLSNEQAQALLECMDRWLSRHDRDDNPSVNGSGRVRAGIGIYYFEESMAQPPTEV